MSGEYDALRANNEIYDERARVANKKELAETALRLSILQTHVPPMLDRLAERYIQDPPENSSTYHRVSFPDGSKYIGWIVYRDYEYDNMYDLFPNRKLAHVVRDREASYGTYKFQAWMPNESLTFYQLNDLYSTLVSKFPPLHEMEHPFIFEQSHWHDKGSQEARRALGMEY
mgnify:CR=1 FL=1